MPSFRSNNSQLPDSRVARSMRLRRRRPQSLRPLLPAPHRSLPLLCPRSQPPPPNLTVEGRLVAASHLWLVRWRQASSTRDVELRSPWPPRPSLRLAGASLSEARPRSCPGCRATPLPTRALQLGADLEPAPADAAADRSLWPWPEGANAEESVTHGAAVSSHAPGGSLWFSLLHFGEVHH